MQTRAVNSRKVSIASSHRTGHIDHCLDRTGTLLSHETRRLEVCFESFDYLSMIFSSYLITFNTNVDVFGLDLIEQSQNAIAADNLTIKVVWLEGLQLHEAIVTIQVDLLLFYKLLKAGLFNVLWWRVHLTFGLSIAASEEISIHI